MLSRRTVPVALAALLALAALCPAVTTQQWRQESARDFEEGRRTGLALSMRGQLTLGPRLQRFKGVGSQFVWDLAEDRARNLYLAGGDPGVVYRLDKTGKVSEFYRAAETHVRCVAVNREGVVFAGACPTATLYRIAPGKKAEVFAKLPDQYVWAMRFDRKGDLWVATGLKARLLRIDPKGKIEEVLVSKENHFLCLALDRSGDVYVGTEPGGLVYRVKPDGAASVVHDFAEPEVRALELWGGSLYVGTAGEIPLSPSKKPAPKEKATDVAKEGASDESDKGKGGVYRIVLSSLRALRWLGTGKSPVLSLARDPDDGLFVGAGAHGQLFRLGRRRSQTKVLADLPEKQVLSMLRRQGKGLYLGCANPGGLVLVEERFAPEGTYTSKVQDTGSVSRWGRVAWEGFSPQGTEILLATRTGNSKSPDKTWSAWSREYVLPDGDPVESPRARFIQYRARLRTTEPSRTPVLDTVTVSYLPMNRPPRLLSVRVGDETVAGEASDAPSSKSKGRKPRKSPPKSKAKAGRKTTLKISWKAEDPDGDKLLYQVLFRGLGDTVWRPIGDADASTSREWDTLTLPDGRYHIRVIASDAPANPPGTDLRTERTSRPIVVDNTRPRLKDARVKTDVLGRPTLHGLAVDDLGAIVGVSVSVTGTKWIPVMASDRVYDSREERFQIQAPVRKGGPTSILVRIEDAAGNIGAARARFQAPKPKGEGPKTKD